MFCDLERMSLVTSVLLLGDPYDLPNSDCPILDGELALNPAELPNDCCKYCDY